VWLPFDCRVSFGSWDVPPLGGRGLPFEKGGAVVVAVRVPFECRSRGSPVWSRWSQKGPHLCSRGRLPRAYDGWRWRLVAGSLYAWVLPGAAAERALRAPNEMAAGPGSPFIKSDGDRAAHNQERDAVRDDEW
jgi:hypothetical protein